MVFFINSFIRTILLSDDNHGLIRNMNLASNLRILARRDTEFIHEIAYRLGWYEI